MHAKPVLAASYSSMTQPAVGRPVQSVAVIGAGVAGLVACKELLAAGLKPTLFDAAEQAGGMWAAKGPRQLLPSLRTNLSTFTVRFSDMPWPRGSPAFPSQQQVGEYLSQYASRFLPSDCMRLGHEVTSLSLTNATPPSSVDGGAAASGAQAQPSNGRQRRQQWQVRWRRRQLASLSPNPGADGSQPALSDPSGCATFDAVVVATGIFAQAHLPSLPGAQPTSSSSSTSTSAAASSFKGELLHSSRLRGDDVARLCGLRVAVIGGSLSGIEAAAELAGGGALVTHVLHRPLWLLPRLLPLDPEVPNTPFVPLDLLLFRRPTAAQLQQGLQVGTEQAARSAEDNRKANGGLRRLLGDGAVLPPGARIDDDSVPQVGISDTYMGLLRAGRITPLLGRVRELHEHGLTLQTQDAHASKGNGSVNIGSVDSSGIGGSSGNGGSSHTGANGGSMASSQQTRVDDLDAIVLCTGYGPRLGFLSPDLLSCLGYDESDAFWPLLLHRATFAGPGNGAGPPGTLGFVGMYRAPYFAAMELQARWIAGVFSGVLPPPSADNLAAGIELQRAMRTLQPRPQTPLPYTDMAFRLLAELGQQPAELPAANSSGGSNSVASGTPAPGGAASTAPGPEAPAGIGPAAAADGAEAKLDAAEAALLQSAVLPSVFRGPEAMAVAAEELRATLAAARRGAGIAGAAFRALSGSWRFQRHIRSLLPSSPSGVVEGEASFTPTTAPSEYLYLEQGVLSWGPGKSSRVYKKYVYCYDHEEDRMRVHFAVERDARGGLFLALRLRGEGGAREGQGGAKSGAGCVSCGSTTAEPVERGQQGGDNSSGGGDDGQVLSGEVFSAGGGWVAEGDHLCVRDMYRVAYRFAFAGAELAGFDVHVGVKGPEKDYTTDTTYTRLQGEGAGAARTSGGALGGA